MLDQSLMRSIEVLTLSDLYLDSAVSSGNDYLKYFCNPTKVLI